AGRDDDALARRVLGSILGGADAHRAVARHRAEPLDHVDAVLSEQAADAAGERLDDSLAAHAHLREVDRVTRDLDAELAGLLDLADDVGSAQHGLGGDAGVVEASAADHVLLDDGGPHPELRGADRRHVSPGTGTDDDAVICGFGHGGECMSPPFRAAFRWPAVPPERLVGRMSRAARLRAAWARA